MTAKLTTTEEKFDIGWAQGALEAARHELTTLHGLWARDSNEIDADSWQINTTSIIEQIDKALNLAK